MLTLKTRAKCVKINKTSQSPAFKGIRIDDIVKFEVPIEKIGYSCTVKAVYVTCENERTKEISRLSFKQLGNIIDGFEFIEV